MNHEVGVDGIRPRVSALCGGERTAYVALLLQNVVELDADGSGIILEERLGNLGIP